MTQGNISQVNNTHYTYNCILSIYIAGRIYVELPHNESRAIGVRVMPKVNVTLDCGYLIESLIGGIPRRVTSSRSTVWYYRRRLSSGSLSSTASIVATSSE